MTTREILLAAAPYVEDGFDAQGALERAAGSPAAAKNAIRLYRSWIVSWALRTSPGVPNRRVSVADTLRLAAEEADEFDRSAAQRRLRERRRTYERGMRNLSGAAGSRA